MSDIGDVKASTSVLNVKDSTSILNVREFLSLLNLMPSNIEQVLKGEVGYYYQIYLCLYILF